MNRLKKSLPVLHIAVLLIVVIAAIGRHVAAADVSNGDRAEGKEWDFAGR